MARLEINLGAAPTGAGGDTPRSANIKVNAMTQELYDTKVSRSELQTRGLAGSNFFAGNIDQIGITTGHGFSTFQLTGETSGTRPAGWSGLHGGLLEAHSWDANTAMQNLCIGGSNYTRFFTGGAWSEWALAYSSANALSQVVGGAGLMDSNYIGTWRVARFQNGFTVLTNSVVPDVELPAAGILHTVVQLPVAFDDYGRVSIDVQCQPSATWDHYGVIAKYAMSPSSVAFVLRNGSVAQRFGAVRVCITGYWKS